MGTRQAPLKEGHGFCEPAFAGQAGNLEHVGIRFGIHEFGPVVGQSGACPSRFGKGLAGSKDGETGTIRWSSHAVPESLFHGWTGVQGTEDVEGGDRLPGQFGRDVTSDAGKSKHLNVQHFASRLRGFEILAAVVAQAEIELVSLDRLPDRVVVPVELVADSRADEVGSIGVEALLDEEIDMA